MVGIPIDTIDDFENPSAWTLMSDSFQKPSNLRSFLPRSKRGSTTLSPSTLPIPSFSTHRSTNLADYVYQSTNSTQKSEIPESAEISTNPFLLTPESSSEFMDYNSSIPQSLSDHSATSTSLPDFSALEFRDRSRSSISSQFVGEVVDINDPGKTDKDTPEKEIETSKNFADDIETDKIFGDVQIGISDEVWNDKDVEMNIDSRNPNEFQDEHMADDFNNDEVVSDFLLVAKEKLNVIESLWSQSGDMYTLNFVEYDRSKEIVLKPVVDLLNKIIDDELKCRSTILTKITELQNRIETINERRNSIVSLLSKELGENEKTDSFLVRKYKEFIVENFEDISEKRIKNCLDYKYRLENEKQIRIHSVGQSIVYIRTLYHQLDATFPGKHTKYHPALLAYFPTLDVLSPPVTLQARKLVLTRTTSQFDAIIHVPLSTTPQVHVSDRRTKRSSGSSSESQSDVDDLRREIEAIEGILNERLVVPFTVHRQCLADLFDLVTLMHKDQSYLVDRIVELMREIGLFWEQLNVQASKRVMLYKILRDKLQVDWEKKMADEVNK
ncbi:hypothetical protein HK096_000822, partial [Nowakowskiella sp. JEL0078]